jgi:hypothetical protein
VEKIPDELPAEGELQGLSQELASKALTKLKEREAEIEELSVSWRFRR